MHALGVDSIGLDADTSAAAIGGTLGFHTLARATVIAEYES
ncbi:YbhB/YbcL family Raf kinase inhibitor-like protein [Kitasatospora griseola]